MLNALHLVIMTILMKNTQDLCQGKLKILFLLSILLDFPLLLIKSPFVFFCKISLEVVQCLLEIKYLNLMKIRFLSLFLISEVSSFVPVSDLCSLSFLPLLVTQTLSSPLKGG